MQDATCTMHKTDGKDRGVDARGQRASAQMRDRREGNGEGGRERAGGGETDCRTDHVTFGKNR